jgi:hypothetical protein
MMPREMTERTVFAPGRADTIPPKVTAIRFPVTEGDRDQLARGSALIGRSCSIPEESARLSPPRLETEVPYFDPPALRELAMRARRFAEMLSPGFRRIMLKKAERLEREAAQQEAGARL